MAYKKPQAPLMSGDDYVYPLTTTDQIIMPDGSRLEKNGVVVSEDSDQLGGKPPSAYFAVNLLDNSYWAQKSRIINQRGQASYTGSGYGIDRWRTNFSGDTIEIQSSGGVKNTINSTTAGWHLYQVLTNCEWMVGKTFTAAFNIREFSGTSVRVIVSFRDSANSEISNASKTLSNGVVAVSRTAPEGTTYVRVGLYAYSGVAAGNYVAADWAALYEGSYTAETLPEYMIKPYSEELAACLRECFVTGYTVNRYSATQITSSLIDFLIPVPFPMRVNPSVDTTALKVYNNSGNTAVGASDFTFTVAQAAALPPVNVITIRATKSGHGLSRDCFLEVANRTAFDSGLA